MKVMTKEDNKRLLLFSVPIHHNHSFFANSARGSRKVALPRHLSFVDSSEAIAGQEVFCHWFFSHGFLCYSRPASRG